MPESLSKFIPRILLPLVLLLASAGARAQSDKLPEISQKFNKHQTSSLQEKLFVHTDKGLYLAGELLWFKIYSVDGTFHRPLKLSRVCYVEVLDADRNPVLQAKVELKYGSGSGSFFLPVSLSSGNYQVTAYTSWMKNGGPDYFFRKQVTILNSLAAPGTAGKETPKKYDLHFFPEGGNLVSGVASKLAFRATDDDGRGVPFQGYVIDQHQDTVSRFSPLRFGIGTFSFTPQPGMVYKAVLKLPGNQTLIKDLPEAFDRGYVMQLKENAARQLELSVQSRNVAPDSTVYLFIHTRQKMVAAGKTRLEQGAATFTINKDLLPGGISHLTVFDHEGRPVCERLYFRRPEPGTALQASTDQQAYAPRKKVTVELSALDPNGHGRLADLSMSVFDRSLYPGPEQDIYSYLWLSSDLKGHVESPEYYLSSTGPDADEALDNLMLTHGWRRFRWEQVLGDTPAPPRHLPERDGHIITGTVIDKRTGAPAPGIVTYLSIPGKRVQLYPSRSSEGGRVSYFTKDFFGPNEIVVQTNAMRDSLYEIRIEQPFEKAAGPALPKFRSGGVQPDWLIGQSVSMQVQNIFSGDRMRKFVLPTADSSAFYGKPVKKYRLADFTRFKTMEEVLREYVVEVVVTRNRGNYNLWVPVIQWDGSVKMNEASLLVDGVPVFDRGNRIIGFDPDKVETIEVVEKTTYLGPATFNSLVNFTTHEGDLAGFDFGPGAMILNYEGLQLQREFYSPQYDSPTEAASRHPDLRNVLFWAPEIRTNKEGKAIISFYTSDETGRYTVRINGLTADGEPVTQTTEFEVRETGS